MSSNSNNASITAMQKELLLIGVIPSYQHNDEMLTIPNRCIDAIAHEDHGNPFPVFCFDEVDASLTSACL